MKSSKRHKTKDKGTQTVCHKGTQTDDEDDDDYDDDDDYFELDKTKRKDKDDVSGLEIEILAVKLQYRCLDKRFIESSYAFYLRRL